MLRSLIDHGKNHYGSVLLNPSTLAQVCVQRQTWEEIFSFHHLLASDEYTQYVDTFYRESRQRYGDAWRYYDIINVLYAAAKTLQPRNYLEIGVRRGRSVCTVARACPTVNVAAFDIWAPNYAGMENPGPDFVRKELLKHGHTGSITFIDGDSHQTVPHFFQRNPAQTFDLITVDGDHSEAGAWDDLQNVIPHLAVGGVLVFDDISHPGLPHLRSVWQRAREHYPFLASFEFGETGYGIGFAIRRE